MKATVENGAAGGWNLGMVALISGGYQHRLPGAADQRHRGPRDKIPPLDGHGNQKEYTPTLSHPDHMCLLSVSSVSTLPHACLRNGCWQVQNA